MEMLENASREPDMGQEPPMQSSKEETPTQSQHQAD